MNVVWKISDNESHELLSATRHCLLEKRQDWWQQTYHVKSQISTLGMDL